MGEKIDIDIVLMWVDGNDPHLQARKQKYLENPEDARQDDVAGPTRYASIGEIGYCVASINKFAPWIHKIWIITDGQDPHLEALLAGHFDRLVPMEIIDHKIIFRGYEEYLPTFNSRALEALLWRIPGLSEHFLLMNDDFFMAAPVQEETFFRAGKTVSYTRWYPAWLGRFLRAIKPKKQGHKPVGFKDSMLNALDIMGGGRRFIYLSHTPRALRKSFYEDFYGLAGDADGRVTRHEEVLLKDIRHRFRAAEQFNSQELFYLQEARDNRLILENPDKVALYLKPRNKRNYINKKLSVFNSNKTALFGCLNSLEQAAPEDQQKVLDWLRNRIFNP